MYTLGINASFHDSSACLVKDGAVIAAAEDERFTHIKHGKRPTPFSAYELPFHAINFCLEFADIKLSDIDNFAYSYNPSILLGKHSKDEIITLPLEPSAHKNSAWENVWDPYFLSSIVNAPRHLVSGAPHHIKKRFAGEDIDQVLKKWHFVEHHLSHAASAFLPSPYIDAAILTIDGRGEKATTTFNIGHNNDINRLGQVDFPSSLGLLYEQVTSYLGFLHSSDEYKVMALASYGKPEFVDAFRSMIHLNNDGTYTIESADFIKMFGPARQKNDEFTLHHFNIAYSLQLVLEETVLNLVNYLYEQTKQENLCFAGGVALNCVLNARIRDKSKFKNIWVQPAAGDAGCSLGAAMWIDAKQRNDETRHYVMGNAYLGPAFSDKEIETFLKWTKVPYKKIDDVAKVGAKLLAEDKIIGWFEGRMEFGPRALGARSILASPIHAEMQAKLNDIKDREDFRPVAPVVLEQDANKYFKNAKYSPYMLFVYNVLPDAAKKIPAVRHVDGTARIQTINQEQNKKYFDLLSEFKKITGIPVLINTSFNTRGEPIVCTPRDAVECFWTSPLDTLIIGSFLLEKPKNV